MAGSPFLVQSHGLTVQVAGFAFTAFGLGLLIGSLAAGGGGHPNNGSSSTARPMKMSHQSCDGAMIGAAIASR